MENRPSTLQLLKEALNIPFKNPAFSGFLFLTWLSLLPFTVLFETILQQTILQSAPVLLNHPDEPLFHLFCYYCSPMGHIDQLISSIGSKLLFLILLHLGIIQPLSLINSIYTVDEAHKIQSEEKIMNRKEIASRLFKEARFRGPFITSVYSVFLSSVFLSGLISLSVFTFIVSAYYLFVGISVILFLVLFVIFIRWSPIANIAAMVSVLEEKEGDVAFVISSYLSRERRKQGVVLSIVFAVWRLGSRLWYLYYGWIVGGSMSLAAATIHSCVLCFGSTMKWLVFTVYYSHCKTDNRIHNTFGIL